MWHLPMVLLALCATCGLGTLEQKMIISCQASTEYNANYACIYAYTNGQWATFGESIGSWIKLWFHEEQLINTFYFGNRGGGLPMSLSCP